MSTEKNYPTDVNVLTREAIDAFPIKSKDMTVAQLRQLCVDFLKFSKQALWICDHDVDYIRNAAGTQDIMKEGQVYGGLPYIGLGTGNVYRTLDYMDENGVVNISGVIKRKKFNRVYARDLWRNFGNQCANGAYVGWGRVINSADYNGSPAMLVANGFHRVGPYTYPDDLKILTKEYNSVAICQENGEQTMYKSYAALQIGDGLNNFTTAGHVVMCSVAPTVVYNEDGSIDGEKSTLCITEQAQKWTEQVDENGTAYLMKPSVDAPRTFAKLFEKGYLPFTFAEFMGTHPVEDTVCTTTLQGEVVSDKELFNSHILCNYGIFDAYATVTDDQGAVLYKHAVRCLRTHTLDLPFIKYPADDADHKNVDSWGELPLWGEFGLKIEVQLATGERPTVYEGKLAIEKPVVKHPLTRETINAFPIKSKDMSIQELRQLCVDFFKFSKQFQWICDHDVDYIRNASGTQDIMKEGRIYGGLPYIGLATGNVYRALDYMDENGVVNISSIIKKKKFNRVYERDMWRNFGNQCANGAYVGWSRVINSADYNGSPAMLVANGFPRVGPYKYPDDLEILTKEYNSVAICRENGEQTMYQSYAAMQIADGLNNFTTAGHVIMCTVAPTVVYNEDGTINGEESFLRITEQSQVWKPRLDEEGTEYLMKPSVDNKYTFAKLYEDAYLPFTFAEFLGTHPIEDTVCTCTLEGDVVTDTELFRSHILCNYGIFDAYAYITDDAGNEIYKHAVRCRRAHTLDLPFVRFSHDQTEHNNVESWGEYPKLGGTYNLKIVVQVATGERPTVYEGKIKTVPGVVKDPLTWDKINAFPMKYKGMPVAERRQLVVDYFRFQKQVFWTPDSDFDYVKNPGGSPDKIYEGMVYGGFPYVTVGSGNAYRMMDFIDEQGRIDIRRAATPARKFGNQCACGVFGGWGRVVNSPNYTYTVEMTVKQGFLRVGPYTYDDDQPRYGGEYPTTYDICKANGDQVMFESYAAMDIGDCLVNYSTAGHIIMCTIAPEIVYNEDGTINGDESFLHITDQAQTWLAGFDKDGDHYQYKNTIDDKRSFRKLLGSGYLPITAPELTGEKDLEDTVCTVDLPGATVTAQELFSGKVTANYGIFDVYAIVTDDAGKECYKHAVRADCNNVKEINLVKESPFVDTWGALPQKGVYDLKIQVQLATGERPVIYTGKLIADES